MFMYSVFINEGAQVLPYPGSILEVKTGCKPSLRFWYFFVDIYVCMNICTVHKATYCINNTPRISRVITSE